MQRSQEQEAIINASFKKIMLIMAYAGTGKSTTLKEYCKARLNASFLYFVFSKDMKADAVKSFKHVPNVKITTFHALAFVAIGKEYIDRLEDELKPFHLEKYFNDDISEDNLYLYAAALLKLLGEFSTSGESMGEFVLSKRREKSEWSIRNGVPLTYLLKMLPSVWEEVLTDDSIPFNHDYYLKLYQLSNPVLDYDYVLVDEAQDITPCMINIVVGQKSKLICVGDEHQAIYSWRGAVNSLQYLRDNYDTSVFYLSKSFRCPEKIGLIADTIIKKAGAEKRFYGVAKIKDSSLKTKMCIARTNGGVFEHCVNNIDSKIYFVGGVKKYGLSDILDVKYLQINRKQYIKNSFIASFSTFKEFVGFANKTKDPSLKALYGIIFKYAEVDLFALIKDIKNSEVKKFEEANFGIVSGHRSKGLEWDNIELLDDFPLGKEKKMKKMTPQELKEENNLLYVAVTRAMCSVQLPEHVQEYISS